jgi:hypothetical protein
MDKKINLDLISKGSNNDDLKSKTIIKGLGKIRLDKKNYSIRSNDRNLRNSSNKSINNPKDKENVDFENISEENKHSSNNKLQTDLNIDKSDTSNQNKIDNETSNFKVLSEKSANDNKSASKQPELAQTNLVNDIHITSNKPMINETEKNKNFSINNVNNIVVIANYDKNNKDCSIKSFAEKFRMKESNRSESCNFEEINRTKKIGSSKKTHRLKNSKLITNQLKNLKYFGEESQENIRKSTKESGIDYKKNIINSLDQICVSQYNVGSNFPLDHKFMDILCINCYECVKCNEVDKHSETCVVKPFMDEGYTSKNIEEDINSKIYKLYQNLRKREGEIQLSNTEDLKIIFNELCDIINTIFLNNNVFSIKNRA